MKNDFKLMKGLRFCGWTFIITSLFFVLVIIGNLLLDVNIIMAMLIITISLIIFGGSK